MVVGALLGMGEFCDGAELCFVEGELSFLTTNFTNNTNDKEHGCLIYFLFVLFEKFVLSLFFLPKWAFKESSLVVRGWLGLTTRSAPSLPNALRG
jgi:hypothetical protein